MQIPYENLAIGAVINVAVEYKKLWIKLIEKDITKPKLRELADLSPATLTKLNKNEHVSMSILERICFALDCSIGDIVDQVKDDSEAIQEEPISRQGRE